MTDVQNAMTRLQEALGYSFEDPTLLLRALTHATWLNEQRDRGSALDERDQQRLEFLGDAFLGFTVARFLFQRHPDADQGVLTEMRKSLVKGEFIGAVGEELQVRGLVRLGAGEGLQLAKNKKVLEDTVEALIGAILEDGGPDAARAVVERLFLQGDLEAVFATEDNPIEAFNTRWQRQFKESPPKPTYSSTGKDNAATWTAQVRHPAGHVVTGEGSDQKQARRTACAEVLRTWTD